MTAEPALEELIERLRVLPGVGRKSAQRMAYHLLERDREGATELARALEQAVTRIGHCSDCRNFSEAGRCRICSDERRESHLLCVVESPADVYALEQAGAYRGRYFLLMGHLSPIDGIGPAEIGIDQLLRRVEAEGVKEIILATGATMEGEATAFYISEQVKGTGVSVSRIAHGVPLGGELEYIDSGTLAHALSGRRTLAE